MLQIEEFPYSPTEYQKMSYWRHSRNWPVTYIIHNDTEAYVGETLDAMYRTEQHLVEPEHDMLDRICLITDSTFNKSVILDLESFLIQYMTADGKYRLQNGNLGVQNHNYFNRDIYEENFRLIWDQLRDMHLVDHALKDIQNSDLFKYSPYKALTREQEDTLTEILRDLRLNPLSATQSLTLVQGGAGTGKTVLAIYLIKLLKEVASKTVLWKDSQDAEYIDELRLFSEQFAGTDLRIGLIVPMQSLRESLKKVFRSIDGLSTDMILSPHDLAASKADKRRYDLLIVDEAHRLRQYKALSQYGQFKQDNEYFGLGPGGTELDWILRCSKRQVLFYDPLQTIKPADIDRERFLAICSPRLAETHELSSQLRCLGGDDYIEYIKGILNDDPTIRPKDFAEKGYDLRLFDDVQEMVDLIKNRNRMHGLCRVVAGYGFKWRSKGTKQDQPKVYDVEIGDFKARWNTTSTDWVSSPTSIDEIGCIHTIQGYDLNYCGVIFGPEIGYDNEAHRIVVHLDRYEDTKGRETLRTEADLHAYIINIYTTLMTRGIRGTYVYACDPDLREYLRRFLR